MPKTVVRTGNHLVYSYQGIALISKNAAKVIKLRTCLSFIHFLWLQAKRFCVFYGTLMRQIERMTTDLIFFFPDYQ